MTVLPPFLRPRPRDRAPIPTEHPEEILEAPANSGSSCSSFCAPEEPCSITETGACDAAAKSAEKLREQFAEASDCLARCQCGSKVIMRYEPGSTSIFCLGEKAGKMSVPDWDPEVLAEVWNELAEI